MTILTDKKELWIESFYKYYLSKVPQEIHKCLKIICCDKYHYMWSYHVFRNEERLFE